MNEIFTEEKKYLAYVLDCLAKEEDTKRKELIEIPKSHTKALQGDTFLVENLMTLTATKLRMLELSENSPYFGRIDFLANGNQSAAKIYIGKTSIKGENSEVATTDWRAPICTLYYDSNLGQVTYTAPSGEITGNLVLKRQIIIEDGQLKEVLDTSLVSNDELLQPYLSVNADNHMKTIIASIQKEQNQIIRKTPSQNIIVQGVAGSGKTSVALHRIAYLVYTLGDKILSNQILSIGPNKYFIDYVSSILPELEVEPIDQKTFLDLANELLKEKYTLTDQNEIFNQRNNELAKKVNSFKASLACKEALDRFLIAYFQSGIAGLGISFGDEVVYSPAMIQNLLFDKEHPQPNFERAMTVILQDFKERKEEIYEKLNEKYRRVYKYLPKGDPLRDEAILKSTELSIEIKEKGLKTIKDYFKSIRLKPLELYKKFIESIDLFTTTLSKDEITEIKKITLDALNKRKVAFEDLPAILHINHLLNKESKNYKYIVIDEAQDYGMFHFAVLKELFPMATYSIYGDLSQSIYSYRSIPNWESVAAAIFNGDCDMLELHKSYRTTIEITLLANNILRALAIEEADPVIRHGNDITFFEQATNDLYKCQKISTWQNNGYKTIAIICKTDKEAKAVYEKIKKQGFDVHQITAKDEQYTGGIFVLTAALAKGLEFDAVLINNASSDVYDETSTSDMHLLYVAITRALHELEVLYDKDLCPVLTRTKVDDISLDNNLTRKKF